jgi:hypothetical protein
MMGITKGSVSILEDFEKAELEEPYPRKIDGERVIYMSRSLPVPDEVGKWVLCDFGQTEFGQGRICPNSYA